MACNAYERTFPFTFSPAHIGGVRDYPRVHPVLPLFPVSNYTNSSSLDMSSGRDVSEVSSSVDVSGFSFGFSVFVSLSSFGGTSYALVGFHPPGFWQLFQSGVLIP